ncbi:MAG: hypothetical protein ACYDCK_03970 [Thermoplasmatota archaeon]
MESDLIGREIENVADNPCFGCGPANPEGLHLRFFDDGDVVRASFTPDERLAGWPGALNAGLTFLALMEACNWILWERLGPSVPTSDVTFNTSGPILLGTPVVVEARVHPDEMSGGRVTSRGAHREGRDAAANEASVRVVMFALQNGAQAASAEMHARRATSREAAEMLARVPSALRAEWEALAAQAPLA